MTKTLTLIDGSGFIFRAYYAIKRDLTNPQGQPVKAVYGFVTMMMKLLESHKADYTAVIFDAARKTFRNDIYPEYKAHRPPAPDDLVPQFALVRDATHALNLPCIEMADYEADDIIATYAQEAQKQGMKVVIVSSDKDLMQLIGGGVEMYDAMNDRAIGQEQVREKFGVAPDKVLDVLSLIGDTSDNVPGVPGIGPKTAAELINHFGDLDTLLARAGEIKQDKRRETIINNTEQAKLSRQLITLKSDVPNLPPLDELVVRDPAPEKLLEFVTLHGFKSLAAKLDSGFRIQDSGSKAETQPLSLSESRILNPESYAILRSEPELATWIAKAQKKGLVAFDTETTGLNSMQAELVGFSLSVEAGEAVYVPLGHITKDSGFGIQDSGSPPDLFSLNPESRILTSGQIPLAVALAHLKPLLEDTSVIKIGHNIKYDMMIMRRYGVDITPVEDTMLLSYVLHAGEHGQGMDELAEKYLGHKNISYDEVTGTGKNRLRFDEVDIEKAGAYAAEDADITMRLYELFKPQVIAEKLLTLYETIERPLIHVLVGMESAGIKVDRAQLAALSSDFAARMASYEQEVYNLAGVAFNIASPKQLGEILFDKLQLPGAKKSAKTGAYGTDSEVLEELALEHPMPAKVLAWRQLAKLKSTYSDALAEQIDPKTGRVHTNYAMAIASTGRLSSNDPNLQNIPIRTVEGKKIRECFIAAPGYKLLSADYSQIELRLLAHVADIGVLKEAFRNGDDIHAITASQMFGVPVSQVDSDLRRKAKTINFGIIYGISAHGLAARLGIGRSEAAEYIAQYFAQYPGIRDYMESSKEYARTHGYVTTLFGRRCHVPGINDKNGARRQFSERAAINAPLQGSAADIIKRAMIAINKRIQDSGFRIQEVREEKLSLNPESRILPPSLKMLLQVHDELVFEVADSAVEAAGAMVKEKMEGAASLSVPLTVEVGVGQHWGDAH